MRSYSVDLIDKVFNIVDSELTKGFGNNGVVWKGDSLSVNFAVSSLENELSDWLSSGISESNIGLNFSQEIGWSFIDSDESSIVDLSQSQ